MRSELFDYCLPAERIAQTPIEPRDAARLLVLREDGRREHRRFLDLPELLTPDDLLVFNDTRVLPARLFGTKETGGRVEALLLQRLAPGRWEALVYPGRRLREGVRVTFGEGLLRAEIGQRGGEGTRILQFCGDEGSEAPDEILHRIGQVPLPPYIHTPLADPERYQTIYARDEGSAAAPTAGLHFTRRVLDALTDRGVRFAYVTLHVGIGTFRPIATETIEEHRMHAEWYSVPEETAEAVRACRGRVVAVGTTTARCLESAAGGERGAESGRAGSGERESGRAGEQGSGERGAIPDCRGATGRFVRLGSGTTRLFITPGYRFRVVDSLLTNFHMPRSSLLLMVSALAGTEAIRGAYQEALEQGYRFLSFGDAMFICGRVSGEG